MSKQPVILKDALLSRFDEDALLKALNIIPRQLHGQPYRTKVRRGEIERRRISLLKADPIPGMTESQELFQLARYVGEAFETVAWAIRSKVSGDYYVFAGREW
jgi:hypothetical protein